MGEYISYKNAEVKIGTCEDLYYTSYQKFTKALEARFLSWLPGNGAPPEYASPDAGFRFRFPFPDEDHLPFGNIKEPFNRGVPIKIDSQTGRSVMEITQQKLVHAQEDGKLMLALVIRDPASGESQRIEDKDTVDKLLKGIVQNHVMKADDPQEKKFYRTIAARILKGYRLESQAMKVNKGVKQKTTKQRRGKGLR
jgi:hypothetical protein